jgi:tRNA-2-methylthio-N6-dimethylallyladenosine synthase
MLQEAKKLHVITYGCQMNLYDSKQMVDLLEPLGFATTPTIADADMVILNTCHIREKAAEKLYSELGRIKPIKDKRKAAGQSFYIAVAGCVSQAEGKQVFNRAPFVDMVVGPQSYHNLPDLYLRAQRNEKRLIDLDFPAISKFDYLPKQQKIDGPTAFLSVQEGCDKMCTFCVVPYTRGAEYSRSVAEIYREAMYLVERGVKEITLLGQNVNAYHGYDHDNNEWDLARLIKHLANIKGLERIRYTTSHPRDMTDDLIQAHGDIAKLMPYLHLPIQSGSDSILKTMNRKHTVKEYLHIIDKLRQARPDIAFSSDIIVGFPGETDADFAATMALVAEVNYAQCYSFKYSRRPGTPADNMINQVPEKVKDERLQQLQELLKSQQRQFNQQHYRQALPVLLEKPGRNMGQLIGRTPYMQSVHVEADVQLIGTIQSVMISELKTFSLAGTLLEEAYV